MIRHLIAHRLDRAIQPLGFALSKVAPVVGAGVTYERRPWRIDAWREDGALTLQIGGFEAVLDLVRKCQPKKPYQWPPGWWEQ